MSLADRQLAAWELLAEGWGQDPDLTTLLRCKACGLGVRLLTDKAGEPYRYTAEQVTALTVLHLRNHHPDLDPDQAAQTL